VAADKLQPDKSRYSCRVWADKGCLPDIWPTVTACGGTSAPASSLKYETVS